MREEVETGDGMLLKSWGINRCSIDMDRQDEGDEGLILFIHYSYTVQSAGGESKTIAPPGKACDGPQDRCISLVFLSAAFRYYRRLMPWFLDHQYRPLPPPASSGLTGTLKWRPSLQERG